MQKLCTISILSCLLFVGDTIGMESNQIDRKVMWDFMTAHLECKMQVFRYQHPYIEKALVKDCTDGSFSLLHCLVECNAVSEAKVLLAMGANIYINTATEVQKYTPLHMVQSKEMAEILLGYGADLEAKDKNGVTPLGHALFHRSSCDSYSGCFAPIVKYKEQDNKLRRYLLEKGANGNAVDNTGNSLLHRTVGDGWCWYPPRHYPEHITLLMQFGADIEVKDKYGKTTYDCAIDQISRTEPILEALREFNIFFVRDAWVKSISWKNKNGEWQTCNARNFLEFLQNGASEWKEYMLENPQSYKLSGIKKILADLLEMAQKNQDSGKITYYKDRGYLFNKVNIANLEEWCGKDSVDYLCEYFKI